MSSQMRETLIESCAEKVIAHAAENGGRCRLGFVKELIGKVSQRAPLLEITRDDINNRVRKIKGQRKEEEQRDVSPAIPFHIIRDPSLSTNSDLSVSASSNEQNPLDILARKIQIKLKISVECNSSSQSMLAPRMWCTSPPCAGVLHGKVPVVIPLGLLDSEPHLRNLLRQFGNATARELEGGQILEREGGGVAVNVPSPPSILLLLPLDTRPGLSPPAVPPPTRRSPRVDLTAQQG
jgi:hypothetical protein